VGGGVWKGIVPVPPALLPYQQRGALGPVGSTAPQVVPLSVLLGSPPATASNDGGGRPHPPAPVLGPGSPVAGLAPPQLGSRNRMCLSLTAVPESAADEGHSGASAEAAVGSANLPGWALAPEPAEDSYQASSSQATAAQLAIRFASFTAGAPVGRRGRRARARAALCRPASRTAGCQMPRTNDPAPVLQC
jgi:hypothetical protein